PEIIDQNLLLTARLRKPLREQFRLPADERLCERTRESETAAPVEARPDGHDDVQAPAAGGLHETLESDNAKEIADQPRRLYHSRPANALARVQVDHDAVRVFDIRKPRVPRV